MKIVLSIAVAFLLIGCSSEESVSNDTKSVAKSTEKSTEILKEKPQKLKKSETLNIESPHDVQSPDSRVNEESKAVEKDVKQVSKKVVETSVQKSKAVVSKVEKTAVVAVSSVDGAKLFTKCSSCHGQNAEKKALNKSQVIKGWSTHKITTALKGYKTGSYGGAMKGVMKAQVANLSDSEIKALATYISSL